MSGNSSHAPLPSISVVICCHNSVSRLPETLRHLAEQEVPEHLKWEILVIDNASTDDTAELVQQFARANPNLLVRVMPEPRLGLAFARERGVAQALHEVILFVDDDNWLDNDYVAIVAETLHQNPGIGALGGMSTAQCDGPQPSWLARYQGWYAVTGPPGDRDTLTEESFLWGAGIAIRRRTFDKLTCLGLPMTLVGRRGGSVAGGEDVELCHLIRLSGEKLYRHSGLHFRHYLPAARLTWEYLRRLHYAAGQVSIRLDAYRFGLVSSLWRRRLVQSWSAQMIYVSGQILRYRLTLWCSARSAEEGNASVLRLETYRGRFSALWAERRRFRQIVSPRTALNIGQVGAQSGSSKVA